MSVKLNQSTTVSRSTIKKPRAKLHQVWVKKVDESQREYLVAVWTTQD
jgi:hypothetical protein